MSFCFFLFGVRPLFVHHRQTFQAPALALLNRVVHTAVVVGGGCWEGEARCCSCLCVLVCVVGFVLVLHVMHIEPEERQSSVCGVE